MACVQLPPFISFRTLLSPFLLTCFNRNVHLWRHWPCPSWLCCEHWGLGHMPPPHSLLTIPNAGWLQGFNSGLTPPVGSSVLSLGLSVRARLFIDTVYHWYKIIYIVLISLYHDMAFKTRKSAVFIYKAVSTSFSHAYTLWWLFMGNEICVVCCDIA